MTTASNEELKKTTLLFVSIVDVVVVALRKKVRWKDLQNSKVLFAFPHGREELDDFESAGPYLRLPYSLLPDEQLLVTAALKRKLRAVLLEAEKQCRILFHPNHRIVCGNGTEFDLWLRSRGVLKDMSRGAPEFEVEDRESLVRYLAAAFPKIEVVVINYRFRSAPTDRYMVEYKETIGFKTSK